MWNVKPDKDKSRGGFQDRDLGKTQFDDDYGPDFGVDYARFSDPPDFQKDFQLKKLVEEQLSQYDLNRKISVVARNGFIILKGNLHNHKFREEIIESVRSVQGVVEIINQITLVN